MNRLADIFQQARSEDRAALIGYLPAGFPNVPASIEQMKTIVAGGVDLVEVGLPFSDPMMDGPTIQDAADTALTNGFRVADIFDIIRELTASGGNAVVMSYWNPILQYGPQRFAEELAASGGLGTIIPDLIPEQAGPWLDAAEANGLANIMLVAPSSKDERLKLTAQTSSGFVYATSHMGVTGTQTTISDAAETLVQRTRQFTDTPVCVGLGISNGTQAHQVAQYADGVIVGSALIKAAMADKTGEGEATESQLLDLARELRDGCQRELLRQRAHC